MPIADWCLTLSSGYRVRLRGWFADVRFKLSHKTHSVRNALQGAAAIEQCGMLRREEAHCLLGIVNICCKLAQVGPTWADHRRIYELLWGLGYGAGVQVSIVQPCFFSATTQTFANQKL